MLDFSNLHIGLTNRCRLECPECPRNQPAAKYIHKMFDIDPDIFRRFLIECCPKQILFCGNWGDPIYSAGFLDLVSDLKKAFPLLEISIHTNGSGKKNDWWVSLIKNLGDQDKIIFSIDGVPTNYFIYRINSQWESVKNAVNTCVETKRKLNKKISIEWKYLVFSYNEKTIIEAYELSRKLGFDRFYLQEAIIDNSEGGQYKWLNTSKPFKEIKNEFEQTKDHSIL